MLLNINFDHNWYCTRHDLVSVNAVEHSEWKPVELPHTLVDQKETETKNQSGNWWYRKQFHCFSSNEELMQSVRLTFTSTDENSGVSPVSAILWLNGVKIFSGALQTPQTSINLPDGLLNSDSTRKSTNEHILIVCCSNGRLSFNSFLTMSCDGIISVKDVPIDANHRNDGSHDYVASVDGASERDRTTTEETNATKNDAVPILTIVMLIVGTRGDVQPFIAYGQALRAVGHRVRLATHEKFRKFVREHGLEFYPLACDPNEIMSFMVENSGIFPSVSSLLKGDIFRRRHMFLDICESTWLACTSADDETGVPFQPDVIIANPISYGHIHCAERLSIPLHMVFTMPYSPTKAFPHPLASIGYSKAPRERLNVLSYTLVEGMMWMGIGDLINKFRTDTLHLPPLHLQQVISMMTNEKVPHTYCWSPSLVPKPSDWPFYIDTSGYFFLDLAKSYSSPPEDLLDFLGLRSGSNGDKKEKSPPIFIGFGSITGHDSDRLLVTIIKALQQTGYRALLTGFDTNTDRFAELIFKIDDIPYDWLFQHVAAVCHHGGAGTTAAGLRAGKPTITVPFFGDQFFWGNVIQRAGAGPPPIPGKDVTVEHLVEAFKFVHKPTTQAAAKRIQEAIALENGCSAAVRSFHAHLPLAKMRSDLESTYPACFRLDDLNLQISSPVARVLLSAGLIDESQLSPHSTREWNLTHQNTSKSNKQNSHLSPTNIEPSVQDRIHAADDVYRHQHVSDVWGSTTGDTSNSVVGSLLSSTEIDPSKYAGGPSSSSTDIGRITPTSVSASTTVSTNNQDLLILAKQAANASGFSPEVCERILLKFIEHQQSHLSR